MKEDVVILYSGGADSRLMLEIALTIGKTPYCLMIHYGQLHEEELQVAANHLREKKVAHHAITLIDLNVESGLTGKGNKNTTGNVHEMHVPGRNSIFLSLAFSVAESREINNIWIGCDWSDRINLFPDCYQEYLVRMNEVFKFAGPREIKIEAPILGLTKETVLTMLSKGFGVSEKDLFSGYGSI
ncbi:7-cyano-7-deazaguanine synthase [Candidatus Pacearchaeota archaeon]|nr:7-cyano-7-deazaguanine synthase [Candidatus Pacearchaeota archaeon]